MSAKEQDRDAPESAKLAWTRPTVVAEPVPGVTASGGANGAPPDGGDSSCS